MKRNRKAITEWIHALESGDYAQGDSALRPSDDQYCCLGVAADLCPYAHWDFDDDADADHSRWRVEMYGVLSDDQGLMPRPLEGYYGLTTTEQKDLARLNDGGASFKQIASYLRETILPTEPAADA